MTHSESDAQPIRFIREGHDLPDAFGAHSRLARAMHVALTSNPDLEVVGLLGAWGSGKSKVMKLLEERMTTKSTRFFTYDAWVHQSDAPRRAFIEALIAFLKKEELADTKQLDESLAKLLKKVETVDVESQPEVSIRLGLVLSIMLLVPVASQFLRADWMKPVDGELAYWFLGRSYSPYFTVALYLTLLPSIALAAITGFRTLMHWRGKKVGGGLTALFVNKGREVRRDQKHTDPEPTALEFQKFFRDLLAKVEATGGCRLIFVIDNVDRLPDQELMTLWSSIRSLFHGEDMGAIGKRPTLLLPLDFEAVERVYEAKKGVAQGFADKTFDIVFRVPPPVSSQWQEYLRRRIEEVFGANAEQEWKTIAARVLEDGEIDSRLPRGINIFVNEIATLWLQWHDEDISFASMAYYTAKRDEIDRNPWRTLQLQVTWMSDFDPHWARGVAALRFGASPAVANQILLEQPLREAIIASDKVAFTSLSRQEGFGTILRRSVEAYRTNSTSLPLVNTVLLMAGLEGDADRNTDLVWACLADGLRTDNWDLHGERDMQALALILQNTTAPGRARARAAVRTRLQHWQGQDPASVASRAVEALRLVAQSAKQDREAFEKVTLTVNVNAAMAFAEALGHDAGLVQISIEPAALADALIEKAVTEEKSVQPLVAAIVAWQLPSVWPLLVDIAASAISERNPEAGANICQLLGEIWRVTPAVRPQMREILRGDPFIDRLVRLLATGDHTRAAVIGALLMLPKKIDPRLAPILASALEHDGFIASLDGQLSVFAPELTVDELLSRVFEVPELRVPIQAMIARRSSTANPSVSPAKVAKRLDLYLELLPPETQVDFWQAVLTDATFWSQLATTPYRDGDLVTADRLLRLVGIGPASAAARDFRDTRFNAAPIEAWQAAFEQGGPLFDTLSHKGEGLGREFGQVVLQGLTRAAASLVKTDDPAFEQRWFTVAKRLRLTSQKLAYRTLWNRILEPGAKRPVRLLRAGGASFLKALRTPDRIGHVLHNVILRGLSNSEDLQWLAKHMPFVAAAAAADTVSEKSLVSAIDNIDRRISRTSERPDDLQALQQLLEELRGILAKKNNKPTKNKPTKR